MCEVHEAFAAQALGVLREFANQTGFEIPDERLNPNGGAVALGHPFGDSGTRLALSLTTELLERGARYGVIGVCVGPGRRAGARARRLIGRHGRIGNLVDEGAQDPVVICYDGSDNAKHAIARAGELLRPGPAVVLHAWQPLAVVMAHGGFGWLAGRVTLPDDEAEETAAAEAIALEGGELARAAGFEVEARHMRTVGSTPHAIIEAAPKLGASVLVMGSRGLSGLKSALLGSVSHEIVMRSHMPVLVIPPERD